MSLLKLLGDVDIGALARQMNMDEAKAGELTRMLAPTIGSAAKKRAEAGDIETVLDELRGEQSSDFYDTPERAASPEARAEGDAFLSRILGSNEAKDELTREAATRAGASKEEVADFMPALAAMLKGGMQKKTPDSSIDGMMAALTGGGGASGGGAAGGGLMGAIGGLLGGGGSGGAGGLDLSSISAMLDADGDGSPLDDILERFMK